MESDQGKWVDPIVAEIRKIRDEYARQFHYNIRAIVADIQKKQEEGLREGRQYVTLSPKRLQKRTGTDKR